MSRPSCGFNVSRPKNNREQRTLLQIGKARDDQRAEEEPVLAGEEIDRGRRCEQQKRQLHALAVPAIGGERPDQKPAEQTYIASAVK